MKPKTNLKDSDFIHSETSLISKTKFNSRTQHF